MFSPFFYKNIHFEKRTASLRCFCTFHCGTCVYLFCQYPTPDTALLCRKNIRKSSLQKTISQLRFCQVVVLCRIGDCALPDIEKTSGPLIYRPEVFFFQILNLPYRIQCTETDSPGPRSISALVRIHCFAGFSSFVCSAVFRGFKRFMVA